MLQKSKKGESTLLGQIHMNDKKRLREIEEELKKSSEKIFEKKPKDIEEELKKETYLGSTKNLAEPSDIKDES